MAYSTKLCFPIQTPCFAPKTGRSKTLMLQRSQIQVKVKQVTVSQPQLIRYPPKNTVFEDPTEGIICYMDENGEVICEGYDEGPRYHLPQTSRIASFSREVEILDLLQRSYMDLSDEKRQLTSPEHGLTMIKWSSFDNL